MGSHILKQEVVAVSTANNFENKQDKMSFCKVKYQTGSVNLTCVVRLLITHSMMVSYQTIKTVVHFMLTLSRFILKDGVL